MAVATRREGAGGAGAGSNEADKLANLAMD